MSESLEFPFFAEPSTGLFRVKGSAPGYTADELKTGFLEWAAIIDQIQNPPEVEPPPEEPAPAAEPLAEPGEYRSSEVTP